MTKSQTPTPTGFDPKSDRRRWGRSQWDHIIDAYKQPAKPHDPGTCPQCHAVHQEGRWHWGPVPAGAKEMLCPACHRVADRYPAGELTLTGAFVAAKKDEILGLAHNLEKAERADHPLNRIMGVETKAEDHLVISTTDIHLPGRIGKALAEAYDGKMDEHYDENGYFVRVNWHRDQ
jgi:hypothetical protein